MKFVYILILLSFFGFKNINAKTDNLDAIQQLPDLSKYENTSKEESSNFNVKDSKSSIKTLPATRKIRHKGLVNAGSFHSNKSPLHINVFGKKLNLSSRTVYFLRLFFGNEKRGPPTVLFS